MALYRVSWLTIALSVIVGVTAGADLKKDITLVQSGYSLENCPYLHNAAGLQRFKV
jgi:hypothetical protein